MNAALSHLKVVDLSRVLAGPWAGQLLADLGAEVIKVERPGQGDDTRHWGPPYMTGADGEPSSESAYFLAANRGKKSLALDITTPEGQQVIRELVSDADILIENFKTGGLEKYGLDYASLKEVNPGLVYCSITGFGQTGPYAHRPGYDALIQAAGGLMSITGEADDKPGGGPQKIGVALSDIMTGLYATVGILAAVSEREQTGLGQHVDLALLDVTAATLANQATNYLVGGMVPGRLGSAHPSIVPYQNFPTADGFCVVAVGNDDQFARFATVLGQPEWSKDPHYSSNRRRVENRDTLCALISDILRTRPTAWWLQQFEANGVPAGPINTIDQVFSDQQILARGMRISMQHSLGATVELPGNPIKLSRTPVQYNLAPPLLGEHTQEILQALKLREP